LPHRKSATCRYLRLRFNFRSIVLLSAMLSALCVMPLPVADAAQVTLGWDSNSEPDLEGYMVYRSVGSPGPPYDDSDSLPEDDLADPLHPKATLTGLQEGNEYYIALTAYNADGVESGFSNNVCVEVVNGAVEACSASAAPVADTASSSGGSSGGGGSSCFISASSGELSMFSKFAAGLLARSRVMTITSLILILIIAAKLKKPIADSSQLVAQGPRFEGDKRGGYKARKLEGLEAIRLESSKA
jgi:hypothetical protein